MKEKKVVYRKEYRMRAVGAGSAETTIPKIIIEREARKRGISPEAFIKSFKVVHLFDDFDDFAAAYRFIPAPEKEAIAVPEEKIE